MFAACLRVWRWQLEGLAAFAPEVALRRRESGSEASSGGGGEELPREAVRIDVLH